MSRLPQGIRKVTVLDRKTGRQITRYEVRVSAWCQRSIWAAAAD